MAASTVNTSREFGGVLAVAILGAIVNAQLVADLSRKLAAVGVPESFRQLVINAVTHGGLPANAAAAAAKNPLVAGNLGLVGRVLSSAEDAFGQGLHVALVVAAAIMLVASVVAFLAGREEPATRTR
jgi:hypothetical protein